MTSIGKKLMFTAAALVAGGILYSAPASAQATRTWVSGVGDDVNPCSRTAPCKTFPGAISKTAAGGEINCLDPGGFGGVTVTKAMTFICDFTEGGVLVTGTNAFTINAADTDVVTISGIDMFGPTTGPGLNGVRFINGAGVNIRNSTIKGFSGAGVSFEVGAGKTSFLTLDNVIIIGNGTVGDNTSGGIRIVPANSGTANVTVINTRVTGNQNNGLRSDLTGTTGTKVNLTVDGSAFTNDGTGFGLRAQPGTGTIAAVVSNTVIAGNVQNGVAGSGTGTTARFQRTTITQNGAANASATTGIAAGPGASLISYSSNILAGNINSAGTASDGAFTSTVAPN